MLSNTHYLLSFLFYLSLDFRERKSQDNYVLLEEWLRKRLINTYKMHKCLSLHFTISFMLQENIKALFPISSLFDVRRGEEWWSLDNVQEWL